MELFEAALAYLHEHGVQRAHSGETLRTYAEILLDWFDTLEQSEIDWQEADAADLIAYRNHMLTHASQHTGRPYSRRTVNHRVRGVLRFYSWAVRVGWLRTSPLAGRDRDFTFSGPYRFVRQRPDTAMDQGFFLLRQFDTLPQPLSSSEAHELLAQLAPPYDLMARWQLYTGARVGELLRISRGDLPEPELAASAAPVSIQHVVRLIRKGGKQGYILASERLLEETNHYCEVLRMAWLQRQSAINVGPESALFIGPRGSAVRKNSYQQAVRLAGEACGIRATSHQLRATFACMMLARLEKLAKGGAAINPLLIVKVLMGHERLATTDRYLRAIAVDTHILGEVLDSLIEGRA
jgi:integrase